MYFFCQKRKLEEESQQLKDEESRLKTLINNRETEKEKLMMEISVVQERFDNLRKERDKLQDTRKYDVKELLVFNSERLSLDILV